MRPVVGPPQYAPPPESGDLTATQSSHFGGHCAWPLWCGSSYSVRILRLKLVDLPVPKILRIIGHAVKWPGDLNLSTSKWGHGSPVSWASLLPIFSFLCPSILDLGSGTGQRDGQTDGQRPSMHFIIPHPMGLGHATDVTRLIGYSF